METQMNNGRSYNLWISLSPYGSYDRYRNSKESFETADDIMEGSSDEEDYDDDIEIMKMKIV